MSKKKLFCKSIIWQIFGTIWISILSYYWFGDWMRSVSFSIVVTVISIFTYVLYEVVWNKLSKI
ncbi:MAG: hypothetical protein CMI82_01440 [Candidatus Pelagibacter sp.]|jgi:hypothetical protein|nr:hypothetical protein [Candidatus Pelagibacter sp.]